MSGGASRPDHLRPHQCRSLRIFQRKPSTLRNFEENLVRIWSQEHRAYWVRSSTGGGAGYVTCGRTAGIWPLREAYALTWHCGPEKEIWFEFVSAEESRALRERNADEAHLTGAISLPEGWHLVPREPTPAMIDAHFQAHAAAATIFAGVPEVWSAMLAAAPPPPRPVR